MGRRSRKRARSGAAGTPPPGPANTTEPREPARSERRPASRIDRMLAKAEERPKAPWHPFPLVELAVLIGIVLIVVGFIEADTPRGRVALVFGMALASLAGLETAMTEHFSGFRSHSTLLAGVAAIAVAAAVYLARAPYIAGLLAGAAVFGLAFWRLRVAFRRRTGVAFKA